MPGVINRSPPSKMPFSRVGVWHSGYDATWGAHVPYQSAWFWVQAPLTVTLASRCYAPWEATGDRSNSWVLVTYPHRKPRLSSWFPSSIWLSPSCCRYLGSEPMGDPSVCLCQHWGEMCSICLSVSGFTNVVSLSSIHFAADGTTVLYAVHR